MTFADQLRTLRTDLGLSQAQVASILGVGAHTVKSWEAGRRQPPIKPVRDQRQILAAISQTGRE